MKVCKRCGIKKELSGFTKRSGTKDGLDYWCRNCKKNYAENYARANPEAGRQYYANNTETRLEYMRLHAANNKEAKQEYDRQYSRNNPEVNKAARMRYRASGGTIPTENIRALINTSDGLCTYCRKELTDDFEIDHIHPVSRGGKSNIENLCLACRLCNRSKSNKTVYEWMQTRGW